ncbi:hypothetical protein Sinac_1807 [Singulisphaera acidiphila DSM 18658]|uniref:Uncharacterized protein n=1 Tax=Singulisphaera acidiphila (strain ATCC BAA-1392 / DSM 18658 / VKM B-2454 / MOB10) TaxID=886293 RepID=L0DBF7_SINAD|nr:hypothetical protein Sinac_1807 [Singulisphaera acidiphila DSM 18658]
MRTKEEALVTHRSPQGLSSLGWADYQTPAASFKAFRAGS